MIKKLLELVNEGLFISPRRKEPYRKVLSNQFQENSSNFKTQSTSMVVKNSSHLY